MFVEKETQVEIRDYNDNSEAFHPYACFYCSVRLTSDHHVKQHPKNCHESSKSIAESKATVSEQLLPTIIQK